MLFLRMGLLWLGSAVRYSTCSLVAYKHSYKEVLERPCQTVLLIADMYMLRSSHAVLCMTFYRQAQVYINLSTAIFYSVLRLKHSTNHKKVQEGNDQEKSQSERNSHSKNRGGKNNRALILRNHIVSRVSSYFPIGSHSVTRT